MKMAWRTRLRQFLCKHIFVGIQLQPRDETGMVTWPCSKCGKVFQEPYGMLFTSHGKITGPWGADK